MRYLCADPLAAERGRRLISSRMRCDLRGPGPACPARKSRRESGSAVSSRVPSWKDDLHALHGLVAVLRRAAAHAAGVVGGDPADHGVVDRRGVRPDLPSVRREVAFASAPIMPGFQRDRSPRRRIARFPPRPRPAPPGPNPSPPVRTGSCPAARKVDGNVQRGAVRRTWATSSRVNDLDDDFRDETVEAGVRAVGERPERVAEDPGRGDGRGYAFVENLVAFRKRLEILFPRVAGSLHAFLHPPSA